MMRPVAGLQDSLEEGARMKLKMSLKNIPNFNVSSLGINTGGNDN